MVNTPSPTRAGLMSKIANERSLLFGLLALQNDLIAPSQLVAAFHAWSRDAARPMAESLREQGALDDSDVGLIEALVAKHIARHDHDTEKSLAAVVIPAAVRQEIGTVEAPDVEATLARVTVRGPSENTMSYVASPAVSGRFRVVRPHASGGLGDVSVALDAELNRHVALKEIRGKFASDPMCQARFLLEAEITGSLEHPGVVPIYSLGRNPDGHPFYAMRFIKGESLKEASDRFHDPKAPPREEGERSLALRQLLRRFVDVCNTIAYAHSRGVIHRDVKPANLLLGPYGETLVVDWGLAKVVGRGGARDAPRSAEASLHPSASGAAETVDGSAMGTPAYMSPEQAAGELDRLGPASDVYSLGATLFYVLTGKPPFEGEVAEVLRRVRVGDFRPPRQVKADVPASLEAICMKAMALRPEDRYASARAPADDVDHWLADEPVSARVEPWTARGRRWVRRHQVGVAVGVLAAALAGVSAAAVALISDSARRSEHTARLALDRSLKGEVAAHAEARDRLFEAGRVIDKFLTNVSYDLARIPGTQPLRMKMLAAAAAHFETLAKEDPAGSFYAKAQGANSLYRVGQLRRQMGDVKGGMGALGDAIARYLDLEKENGTSPVTLDGLGNSYIELGLARRDLGDLKGAEESWRLAITAHEAERKFKPSDPGVLTNITSSTTNLGLAAGDLGDSDAALAAFRRVVELRSGALKIRPDFPLYENFLGSAHSVLGSTLHDCGQLSKSLDSLKEAIRIRERLLAREPENPDLVSGLLWSRTSESAVLRDLGRLDEAAELVRQGEDRAKSLLGSSPGIPEYLELLGQLQVDRARVALARNHPDEAEAASRRAVATFGLAVDRQPDFPAIRSQWDETRILLAESLRKLDRPRDALDDLERVMKDLDTLAEKFPHLRRIAARRASAHAQHGALLAAIQPDDPAEAALRDATERAADLARRFPTYHEYHGRAAEAAHDLALLLVARKKAKEAEAAYELALRHQADAVKLCPEASAYRDRLAAYQSAREELASVPASAAPVPR